jgi:hypothetical protein
MGCFSTILVVVLFLFVMVSMIRWFEQITHAVDNRWWNKVAMLVFMPFTVWFYPSRVGAGRPTAVPLHEPVRGFGTGPSRPVAADAPPPGTPKEFLEMPKVPPPAGKKPKPAADADKMAKLKQKMREQGMLPPEE